MRKTGIVRAALAFILLVAMMPVVAQQPSKPNPVDAVDSLLAVFDKAGKQQRLDVARQLIDICYEGDQLLTGKPVLTPKQSRDTLCLHVWFAAERFYYNNSYFKEALAYIDRALPLTVVKPAARSPQDAIHATLLCDRGYCLFKTGRNAEATDAELQAERFSKSHGQLLSLARAYNYLAIINISLGYTDEAEWFVLKAIDTDAQTGSDINTHNYLGIACEVYNVAKKPQKAIEYGLRAVEAARKIGYEEGVVNHLSQLSYAYNRAGDLERALAMSREAVATVERMPIVDRNLLAISLEYVAFNLLDMKRGSEAVPVIRRAIDLQQQVGNTRSVCYDYKSLAEALEPKQPREALAALRRYSVMMDSLHYAEMHEKLSSANAQLHNDQLKEENAHAQQRTQRLFIISLLATLLLLGIIATLVYINRLRTRTQQAVERLQATRETFFTNVTHEFRTPLTVILGVARQLRDNPQLSAADAHFPEQAALIERNGQELLSLVNQLLDISKVKSAVGESAWCRGDIVPMLIMIAESHRSLAEPKGVELRYDPTEPTLVCDYVPDYLQKVVGNLLSNALKNTPEGGSITLDARSQDDNLVLTVSDTGCGIQPEDLPHIFEPFYQGRQSQLGQGSGIGLAFTREIVEACHGTISCTSDLGRGTTFRIVMPRRLNSLTTGSLTPNPSPRGEGSGMAMQPEKDNSLTPNPSPRGEGSGMPILPEKDITPLSPRRGVGGEAAVEAPLILIVEDNRDVARYIGSVLADAYEVVYADNGRTAMERALALVPDLIVTDLMMPDTDGLTFCRQVRQSDILSHIPIVIITARVTDDDRLQGIEAGADAYLSKPFRADELQLRVAKLLESRRRLSSLTLGPSPRGEGSGMPIQPEKDITPLSFGRGTGGEAAEAAEVSSRLLASQLFLSRLDDVIRRKMEMGDISIEAVANELCMSRSQLQRKLRALVDQTPSAYILDLRLCEAKRMLSQRPAPSVLSVAMRCGFADNAHLTHAFRRKFGITPSQFVKEQAQPQ